MSSFSYTDMSYWESMLLENVVSWLTTSFKHHKTKNFLLKQLCSIMKTMSWKETRQEFVYLVLFFENRRWFKNCLDMPFRNTKNSFYVLVFGNLFLKTIFIQRIQTGCIHHNLCIKLGCYITNTTVSRWLNEYAYPFLAFGSVLRVDMHPIAEINPTLHPLYRMKLSGVVWNFHSEAQHGKWRYSRVEGI